MGFISVEGDHDELIELIRELPDGAAVLVGMRYVDNGAVQTALCIKDAPAEVEAILDDEEGETTLTVALLRASAADGRAVGVIPIMADFGNRIYATFLDYYNGGDDLLDALCEQDSIPIMLYSSGEESGTTEIRSTRETYRKIRETVRQMIPWTERDHEAALRAVMNRFPGPRALLRYAETVGLH